MHRVLAPVCQPRPSHVEQRRPPGLRKQNALLQRDAKVEERPALVFCLHPLGDDAHIKVITKGKCVPDDALAGGVCINAADEADVELEQVRLEVGEQVQPLSYPRRSPMKTATRLTRPAASPPSARPHRSSRPHCCPSISCRTPSTTLSIACKRHSRPQGRPIGRWTALFLK